MLTIIKDQAKSRNNMIMFGLLFLMFLALYIFLDFEGNMGIISMKDLINLNISLV